MVTAVLLQLHSHESVSCSAPGKTAKSHLGEENLTVMKYWT